MPNKAVAAFCQQISLCVIWSRLLVFELGFQVWTVPYVGHIHWELYIKIEILYSHSPAMNRDYFLRPYKVYLFSFELALFHQNCHKFCEMSLDNPYGDKKVVL